MAQGHAEWCNSPMPTHRAPPKMSAEELQQRIRGHKMFADATASQAHKQQKQQERLEEVDLKIRTVRLPDDVRSEAHHRMYYAALQLMAARQIKLPGGATLGVAELAQARIRAGQRAYESSRAAAPPTHRSAPRSAPNSARSEPQPSLTVSSSALDEIIARQYEEALRKREAKRQGIVQRLETQKTFKGPLPIFAHASREEAEETVERMAADVAARLDRARRIAREQAAKAAVQDWPAEEEEYNHTRWPHAPPRKLARRPEPPDPRGRR